MKFFGNIGDWFRKHKVLGFSVGLMILGIVGIVLYTSVRTTSDRAITQGQKELDNQTENVEKVVKKESKDLDFEVPMVEDVADAITEQEDLDGELNLIQKYSFIKEEFGEDVYLMSMEGLLPSRKLTVNQNKQQLDQIKQLTIDGYPENEGAWSIDTSKFLFEDGTIESNPNIVVLTDGYTLDNQSQFFNVGDYSVGGFHINSSNLSGEYGLEGYSTDSTIADKKSAYETLGGNSDYINTLSSEESVTVITYFVRANEKMPAEDMLQDLVAFELSVNDTKTLEFTKEETSFLVYDQLFGTLGLEALEEKEVQSSDVYIVRQYITGNIVKDSNNKISIAGSEYSLKKVSANDAIDLTNTYSE